MAKFADLHFHPGATIYNRLRNTSKENDPRQFHPWNILESNLKRQKKGKRGFGYSQADFAKCTKGKVKLAFASLYPMEKGFLQGYGGRAERKEIQQLFHQKELKAKHLSKPLAKHRRQRIKKTTALDYLQSVKMGFSTERVNFIQGQGNSKYDYYEDLIKEYEFYLSKNNVAHTQKYELQLGCGKEEINGKYVIAKNASDVDIAHTSIVLTIEGMHAFGIGNMGFDGVDDIPFNLLQERIQEMKEVRGPWKHPILFITFAHHFDNTLCGHAHSMPFEAKLLSDQSKNMDEGMFANGYTIANQLLGIVKNENLLMSDGSRRVLLDVKHMSAKARQDYYNNIITPYNNQNQEDKIPVIASHVGHSGYDSLQDQIDHLHKEKDNARKDGFYAWNINICDEDVKVIHESEGLIGLNFDQRILGIGKKFLGIFSYGNKKGNNISAFDRTIRRIVKTPFQKRLGNPINIWNCISLGSDFEGYVDPIDEFSTVLKYEEFAQQLKNCLQKWKNKEPEYFGALTVDEIIENISYGNAERLAKKYIQYYPKTKAAEKVTA